MRNELVALGLGSNLDRPLANLRQALQEIKKIPGIEVLRVSSIYESEALLPVGAPLDWNQNFLNAVVLCQTAAVDGPSPFELLMALQKIEIKMGRVRTEKWAPRFIDLDILVWENQVLQNEDLQIPHPHILNRPFVLLPLQEVWPAIQLGALPHWAHSWVADRPFSTVKSARYFWPEWMGILNITDDSFSDGGSYLSADKLLSQTESLLGAGASILDFGAESTRPGAAAILPEVEAKNLNWALEVVRSLRKKYSFKVSLDCRHGEVVEQVLQSHRVDFLNDVSGFSTRRMQDVLKASNLEAFVMHSLSVPADPNVCFSDEENPICRLTDWWQKRKSELVRLGVGEDKLIFDPGIGFGKSKRQSLFILQNLEQFSVLKSRVLIGHSRKSFQKLFSESPSKRRDLETSLVTRDLNLAFVQYLRVHDVESQKPALRI